MRNVWSDSAVVLGARVVAGLVFLLVVIKCVKEYQGRPFIIDLTYLSKTSGSSTITTTAASTSVANAAFPDLIICSAQETQDEYSSHGETDEKSASAESNDSSSERTREGDKEEGTTPSIADYVVDCTIKNYTVTAQDEFINCAEFFTPYFHQEYKFCAQMRMPSDVKYQASKLNAGYFGVHLTLFLDSTSPLTSTGRGGRGPAIMPPHSKFTGVIVGLQASSDDWLSDVTWTSTPPGGFSVKVIYQKIYHVKLSKQRSHVCRNKRLMEAAANISDSKRASSCEKFIDYEVQTRANMFPTSQFGPILLSRACLYSARTRPHNHSLTTRLQHLIRTGKSIET
ncbi:uncharacterized protein LOC134844603 [Symsagittifera roscoffensis]|uniref:uncharacterized protein LOC134844603 n=1 Tax=Symsagittifera roscoffensis TaxID=84072 RepID=UPI00307B18E4